MCVSVRAENECVCRQDTVCKVELCLAEYNLFIVFAAYDVLDMFYLYIQINGTLPDYDVSAVDTTGAGDAFSDAVTIVFAARMRDRYEEVNTAVRAVIVEFTYAAAVWQPGNSE